MHAQTELTAFNRSLLSMLNAIRPLEENGKDPIFSWHSSAAPTSKPVGTVAIMRRLERIAGPTAIINDEHMNAWF